MSCGRLRLISCLRNAPIASNTAAAISSGGVSAEMSCIIAAPSGRAGLISTCLACGVHGADRRDARPRTGPALTCIVPHAAGRRRQQSLAHELAS